MRTRLPYEHPIAYGRYFVRRLARTAKAKNVRERLGLPTVDRETWVDQVDHLREQGSYEGQ